MYYVWSKPAEEGEDDVGGHTQDGGQRDRDADSSGPERAVVAVIVELETASHHHQEAGQTSHCYGVSVQLPAEPPLVNIIVCRHEQRLPGPSDEQFLEENLRQVKHGDQAQEGRELEHCVDVLSQLRVETLLRKHPL